MFKSRRYLLVYAAFLLPLLICCMLIQAGCHPVGDSVVWHTLYAEKYRTIIESGKSVIPEVREMELLFKGCEHQSDKQPESTNCIWHSSVYVHKRYELLLTVPVELNADLSKIVKSGEPKFTFQENIFYIDKFYTDNDPDRISYRITNHVFFSRDKWKQIVKAKGDFSVLGITIKTNQPVRGIK